MDIGRLNRLQLSLLFGRLLKYERSDFFGISAIVLRRADLQRMLYDAAVRESYKFVSGRK